MRFSKTFRHIIVLIAIPFVSAGCRLFPVDWKELSGATDKGSGTDSVSPAEPAPAETFGLDSEIPKTMQDVDAAAKLAAVADGYADAIAFDGDSKEPLLKTTADVGRRFKRLNEYAWHGKNRLATDEFKKLTGNVTKKTLEPNGNPEELTEDRRGKAVSLFRATAFGLRQVKSK